jgi:hypothetical protein
MGREGIEDALEAARASRRRGAGRLPAISSPERQAQDGALDALVDQVILKRGWSLR